MYDANEIARLRDAPMFMEFQPADEPPDSISPGWYLFGIECSHDAEVEEELARRGMHLLDVDGQVFEPEKDDDADLLPSDEHAWVQALRTGIALVKVPDTKRDSYYRMLVLDTPAARRAVKEET